MRLTNIDCPQCAGQLNQQGDRFYCTSCGSAFNIDYDETDVEYAKLVTEPERTRLLLENNRILLEKNEELRKKFITGERRKEIFQEVKKQGMTFAGAWVYALIIGGMSTLLCIIAVAAIFFSTWKNAEADIAKREQAKIESIEKLSAADIENDKNFLENAIAGGIALEAAKRDRPVKDDDRDEAYVEGDPVPVTCRLMKTDKSNSLCIVYKITYKYSEDDITKDIYDCIVIDDISLDETGHIKSDYDCDRVSGDGKDDEWNGYEDADGVFEDNTFPEDCKFFRVDI